MLNRSLRRNVLLLLLGVAVAVPWPASAQPAQALKPAARLSFFDQVWSIFRSLWSEEGCGIDPSGLCVSSPAPQPPFSIQAGEGCNIDPSGRCRS